MGQKTNPKGFRLVTTQPHLSNWYQKKLTYNSILKEDYLIRSKIAVLFQPFLSISRIEIERVQSNEAIEHVNIKLRALFPRASLMYKEVGKYFESSISKKNEKNQFTTLLPKRGMKYSTNLILKERTRQLIRFFSLAVKKQYSLKILYVKNPFEDAALITKYISEQLKRRIPFRRTVKQAIKKVQFTSMKGLKIEVSGRLNGIDIARSEWKREGKIPLHTLDAKIDYTHQHVQTVYGLIGIKVWLFSGINGAK